MGKRSQWLQPEFVFGIALFAVALIALNLTADADELILLRERWLAAVFFVVFGLFTIAVGFPHPSFGHVSFDRVAQVASILVLGPVAAAIINGLASLLYPWHRLLRGEHWTAVLKASLTNAGLMVSVILVSGLCYTQLGGSIPLFSLDGPSTLLLLALIALMQAINHGGMAFYVALHGGRPADQFNAFTTSLEIGSGVIGVLVALVFNRLEPPIFIVLLAVLAAGMFALKQFAIMRQRLEALVDERTRELREKSLELERQATQDKLTGLYNRRYADNYLAEQLERSNAAGQRFTVAFADIDHFKRINDHHSHAQGDQVLTRVAQILAANCRSVDMVSRYGGEEFLLCFPGKDIAGAVELCERLRAAVEAEDWSVIAPGMLITLSFGIAENASGTDIASLLAAADHRLYEAKYGGRNRVVA